MKVDPKIIAKLLKGWEWSERTHEIPFFFEHLPEPPIKILDVGCCDSQVITELDKLGYDAWGIDMHQYNWPYHKFMIADGRNMPFEDNSFDMVYSISVIEHAGLVRTPYDTDTKLDVLADVKIFNEMLRVVKPDGKIVITLPYGFGHPNLDFWIKFFNQERLEHLIDNDLFVMDKIEYTYCIDRVNFKWAPCDEYTARMQVSMKDKVMANMCFVGHKKI